MDPVASYLSTQYIINTEIIQITHPDTHTWHNWQTAEYASFIHEQNDQHEEAGIYKPHLLLKSILPVTDN